MVACRFIFRVDRVLKFPSPFVGSKPINYFQGKSSYHGISCYFKMGDRKGKQSADDCNKKQITVNPVWRPVCTQASSYEEYLIKEVSIEAEEGGRDQEVGFSTLVDISDPQHAENTAEAVSEIIEPSICSDKLEDVSENKVLGVSELSTGKHSISLEVGASLIRFIKGKGGSTQQKIEEEMGVKILFSSSMKEDSITIEANSIDCLTRASERIQAIIDEAVKSPSLDYSHFISLPLAIHPELVDKLVSFQNSILGNDNTCMDPNTDSNEDTGDDEEEDQGSKEGPNVAVQLKLHDNKESVKVNITDIPLVSYQPKVSKSHALSDLGIEKSIFIKPKTFHLTVLMLKLWNKDRVKAAVEVLKSISSRVMEALDNQPVMIKLKGLDCMRGSLAKARVLYVPVEEIGSVDRVQRACQIIIDAYVGAGLVLEKDTKQKLKLHATVMNARHRKRKKRTRKVDHFDARGIFEQYGKEEWGEYLIHEAHLSQRFVFDDNGYYHCCASIPFPENMQVD